MVECLDMNEKMGSEQTLIYIIIMHYLMHILIQYITSLMSYSFSLLGIKIILVSYQIENVRKDYLEVARSDRFI